MADQRVSIKVPEPHFTLFNATRSSMPEVVVVNDALLSFPHTDIFPWHLIVTMEVIETVENGMPSPEESELLFDIGDQIEANVLGGRTEHGSENAIFVARSTWNAQRELLFQVHDPKVTHEALQQLLESRRWARAWSYRMAHDAAWEGAANVFQLFPQANGRDA